MKKTARVIAWLLTLCMVLSVLPAGVFAAGEDAVLSSAWEIENQNDKLKLNADGSITITTQRGAIGDGVMQNVMYYKIPNQTDYEFTVKVQGNFAANYQGAFLMIASGKGLQDVVGVVRRYHTVFTDKYGTTMLMGVMQDGDPGEYYEAATDIGNEFYLKLQKQNGRITGFYAEEYSENDADWNQIIDDSYEFVDKGAALIDPEEIYLALGASAGGSDNATDVTFSELRIGGELVPFVSQTDALAKVELTGESQLDVGKTMELGVKCVDYEGNAITDIEALEFSSSDETVATVDDNGVVTGVANGNVTITAQATADGVTRTGSIDIQIGQIVTEGSWTVTSPDGNTSITMELLTGGILQYRTQQDGVENIKTSPLGMVTNLGNFTEKLVVKEASEIIEIDESYEMYSGKDDVYVNHCFEQTVTFTRAGSDAEFSVVLRAYDDGTALRYLIDGQEGTELSVSDETTGLTLPEKADVRWMNYASASWNYESSYQTTTTEGLGLGATPSIPMLYGKDGVWTLYTEADLNGSYTGSMLTVTDTGVMDLTFSKTQGSRAVVTTLPFASPWRVAITGTPEDIIENTLVENLATPADEETYKFSEWVEPGLSSWSWVASWGSGISDQSKAETHLNWIEFGAEIGWDYYILDEGWAAQGRGSVQPNASGMRSWWPEVKAAAEEAGVKLWAWVHVSDIRDNEKREALFNYWASEGIVGIKPDFFDGEDQATMQLYDELYEDAAAAGLMVLVHGANKPTGEIRTWPNVYGREAIAGQEQGGITSEQYTMIPFIRAAVGPAEVTEELRSKNYNRTTMGWQVAMTVLVEDGIHSMGSAPDVYRSVPEAMAYYTNFPGGWDDTEFVNGEIGEYVSIARLEKGGGDWYVSGITVDPMEMDVELEFLDEGVKYVAMLIKENGRQDIDMEVIPDVTRDSVIAVSMLYGGGYSIKLVPQDESVEAVIMDGEYSLNVGDSLELTAQVICGENSDKTVSWSVGDMSVATIDDGVLTAVGPGVTTVTATSNANASFSATAIVMVQGERLDIAEGWEIVNPSTREEIRSVLYADEPNKTTITTLSGDVGNPFNAQNLWLREAPEGDFEVTMKLSGGMNANWQKVGIVAVAGEEDTVSVVRRYHEGLSNGTASKNHFGMYNYNEGYNEPVVLDSDPTADAWLKMVKKGDTFYGYYSYDGETWIACHSITNAAIANADDLRIGFYAVSGGNDNRMQIDVSDFTLDGDVLPLSAKKTVAYAAIVAPAEGIDAVAGDAFETLALPETVTVYFDTGIKADVKVIWDSASYDSARVGLQTVTGALDLSGMENAANPEGLTAQCEVLVAEKELVNPFTDLTEDWYVPSVLWAYYNGITKGASDTTFEPDEICTRAQVVTFLWRAAGEPAAEGENPFGDVPEGEYYYDAVLWAVENGITQGTDPGVFSPDETCTRAQIVTFLYRFAGEPEVNAENPFVDVADSEYYYNPVLWAVENGITKGDGADNTFNPDGECLRCQIVTFLYRYLAE